MTGNKKPTQKLPGSGPKREALRKQGQFWTPDWVAEAMVGYVLGNDSDTLFDPAVGEGAFFRAAKVVAREIGTELRLFGAEIDPDVLRQARQSGLSAEDLASVEIGDFVLDPPKRSFEAIVANPPYIRHHRLPAHLKAELRMLGANITGRPLDGRAGLHVYFLLRALRLLSTNGRLAFIMPADTCEGVFAPAVWNWITRSYRLEAVITFAAEASPFPKVDTNPIILMLENAEPTEQFAWVKCMEAQTGQLKRWVLSGFKDEQSDVLRVHHRRLREGLTTGLSRLPVEEQANGRTLLAFAKVSRGIATGANEFFFLTAKQAHELGIPGEFLLPAIGRTRDVPGDEVSPETIKHLDRSGRPTLLFSPDARPMENFPRSVREYLQRGETMELHKRSLISMRRPWYKMEVRSTPPILFAYLDRRNTRFIRNSAGVAPLTGFLCVYPREKDMVSVARLYAALRHPDTVANLSAVGKSYGAGAIKVEPRALERLLLPAHMIAEAELQLPQDIQPTLL